jgi:hypothetical protein
LGLARRSRPGRVFWNNPTPSGACRRKASVTAANPCGRFLQNKTLRESRLQRSLIPEDENAWSAPPPPPTTKKYKTKPMWHSCPTKQKLVACQSCSVDRPRPEYFRKKPTGYLGVTRNAPIGGLFSATYNRPWRLRSGMRCTLRSDVPPGQEISILPEKGRHRGGPQQ